MENKTVSDLAALVSGRVVGEGSVEIKSIASLETASKAVELCRRREVLRRCGHRKWCASCLIVPAGAQLGHHVRIEIAKPKLAFALIAEILHPPLSNVASPWLRKRQLSLPPPT